MLAISVGETLPPVRPGPAERSGRKDDTDTHASASQRGAAARFSHFLHDAGRRGCQTAHAVLVWDVDRNEEVGASDVEGDASAAG